MYVFGSDQCTALSLETRIPRGERQFVFVLATFYCNHISIKRNKQTNKKKTDEGNQKQTKAARC